jgi:hypothetical protein
MNGQRWVISAVLAAAFANAGCVSCCDKSYKQALSHGADCDLPTPCRNQVYAFMIHGLTPSTDCGLDTLRTKLAENGFAKVGVGETVSALTIECEIKHLRKCDPEAKFVLIGYDLGGAAAVCIARDLCAKNVPVEAVVLLDPIACGEASGIRTLLVTSGVCSSTAPHTDRVVVPDASHFGLPAHPTTVTAITELFKDIATAGYQAPGDPVPEWTYKHAPEMHRSVTGRWGEEWDFLSDRPGTTQAINTRTTTYPTPTQAAPVSTSAGPVVIKR